MNWKKRKNFVKGSKDDLYSVFATYVSRYIRTARTSRTQDNTGSKIVYVAKIFSIKKCMQ